MKAIAAIALAGTLLSGCAGRYVDLYVSKVPTGAIASEQVKETLTRLHTLGERFSSQYRTASRNADLAEVPLIGAAVVTALLAVNKPSSAADTLAKVGIGTGTYVALRSLFVPSGGPDVLRKGVRAINCVLVEGAEFVVPDVQAVDAKVNALRASNRDLEIKMNEVQAALEIQVFPTADKAKAETEIAQLTAARATAKLALIRANAASLAARSQIGAYDIAPARFETAATEIVDALATRSAVRVPIDVSALAESWVKKPQADAEGAAGSPEGLAEGQTMAAVISKLEDEINALNDLTAAVQPEADALHFVDRLKALTLCPALV